MDNELVTDSESGVAGCGGKGRQQPVLRYGDKFEELCGYYMSLGMSYTDYWDGDADMPKYYRDMAEKKRNHENELLWLQGLYIYEALLDASPVFNAFSKKSEPYPYRSTPIPLDEAQSKRQKEEENMRKMANGKEAMRIRMAAINQKFLAKGGNMNV